MVQLKEGTLPASGDVYLKQFETAVTDHATSVSDNDVVALNQAAHMAFAALFGETICKQGGFENKEALKRMAVALDTAKKAISAMEEPDDLVFKGYRSRRILVYQDLLREYEIGGLPAMRDAMKMWRASEESLRDREQSKKFEPVDHGEKKSPN